MAEERYPDLNEKGDIRFDEIWDDHWRDIAEDNDDKNNIHDLMWDVYVMDKEELIAREFFGVISIS